MLHPAEIFDLLHERSIDGRDPALTLATNCEVVPVEEPRAGRLRVVLTHAPLGQTGVIDTDALLAATGYRLASVVR